MKRHKDDHLSLTKTGFTVLSLEYSRVKAIMAEFNPDEGLLRRALKEGHQIEITDQIAPHAVLHIVADEEMARKMHDYKIHSPTLV